MNQLEIPLVVREDKYGDEYYIGSTDLPIMVDLSKVTVLVFHPQDQQKDGPQRATLMLRPRVKNQSQGQRNRLEEPRD
jgi:hypothetical protein